MHSFDVEVLFEALHHSRDIFERVKERKLELGVGKVVGHLYLVDTLSGVSHVDRNDSDYVLSLESHILEETLCCN